MKGLIYLILATIACSVIATEEAETRSVVAYLTVVPKETEYKTPYSQWMPATQGQAMLENYEARNTNGQTYVAELLGNNRVEFPDGPTTVYVGSFVGDGEYMDAQGQTYKLEPNSTISTIGIYAASGTVVPISITGSRSAWKPKGWGGRESEE